jgi:purine-binding chemotaxis protein CheW
MGMKGYGGDLARRYGVGGHGTGAKGETVPPASALHSSLRRTRREAPMTEAETGEEKGIKGPGDRVEKYLTFTLGKEEYGIGILGVKEIIGMMPITPVPRTPGYVKGVINLRGKVIPLVDLRLKLGMAEIGYTDRTCIIVVEIAGLSDAILMGMVVDSVSEVLNIRGGEIEETSALTAQMDPGYILGMAKMKGRVKILLDVGKVLHTGDLGTRKNAHYASPPISGQEKMEGEISSSAKKGN